jgi:hypothetical protein
MAKEMDTRAPRSQEAVEAAIALVGVVHATIFIASTSPPL